MLNASLLWSCAGVFMYLFIYLFFWVFKDCLRIFVMFVNVEMCKIVLIAGESTD